MYTCCIQSDYIVIDENQNVIWLYNIIPFIAELAFVYLFILLFIYSFFNKMCKLQCFIAYTCIMLVVLSQYKRTFLICYNVTNQMWYNNLSSINVKILLIIIVFIVIAIMFLIDNKKSEINLNFDSLCLILLCVIGILLFLTTNNLFVLYLGIELQSLALYILCCLKRYSNKSLEAGFKYYLYGSFSSAILLFGISLLYGTLGCLELNDIYILINIANFEGNSYILLQLALICILIGFLFKLAVFPFHWWLADVYEGTADIITFFLAVVPKLPFFFVLSNLYINIFSKYIIYSYIMTYCGICSIILGTILALYEIKIKKLLAYSSIVHMGYIIIALATGSKIGLIISFYYFFIYIIVTIYIFTIYLAIRLYNNNTLKNITDLVYLKNNNKWVALITIIALLSLAGIPPLIGFYGKLYIFYILIADGNYYICLILLLLSILSCVYYIRLIRFIFFDDKVYEPMVFIKKQSTYIYMIIAFFFLININFLFFQEPLLIHLVLLFF